MVPRHKLFIFEIIIVILTVLVICWSPGKVVAIIMICLTSYILYQCWQALFNDKFYSVNEFY